LVGGPFLFGFPLHYYVFARPLTIPPIGPPFFYHLGECFPNFPSLELDHNLLVSFIPCFGQDEAALFIFLFSSPANQTPLHLFLPQDGDFFIQKDAIFSASGRRLFRFFFFSERLSYLWRLQPTTSFVRSPRAAFLPVKVIMLAT